MEKIIKNCCILVYSLLLIINVIGCSEPENDNDGKNGGSGNGNGNGHDEWKVVFNDLPVLVTASQYYDREKNQHFYTDTLGYGKFLTKTGDIAVKGDEYAFEYNGKRVYNTYNGVGTYPDCIRSGRTTVSSTAPGFETTAFMTFTQKHNDVACEYQGK